MLGFNRKMEVPDVEFMSGALQETCFTPDIARLEKKAHWLIFLYDYLLEGHPVVAKAFTSDPMVLWKKNLGSESYPIALPQLHRSDECLKIAGNIYRVEPAHIIELDRCRENGVSFKRERVPISVPYRDTLWTSDPSSSVLGWNEEPVQWKVSEEQRFKTVMCWAYLGIPSYWKDVLDGGYTTKKVTRFQPRDITKPMIYRFTKMEYDDL